MNGIDLAPVLGVVEAEAERCEQAGMMTQAVLEAFETADLFRLWVPRDAGGRELDLLHSLEVFEAVSRADGSCGWIVTIGAGGGLFGALLDREVAAEVFSTPRSVIAGSGQASGVARSVAAGYRVSGRWRYASGAAHATWFTANCQVEGAASPGEAPVIRAMAFPRERVEILPTWNVAGMRATASHDFAVAEVDVLSRYSFSVLTGVPRCPGPLYRFPFGSIAAVSFAAAGLGIGRHAIEAFTAIAREKVPAQETAPLAAMGSVQALLAEAEVLVASARAYLYEQAQEAWEAICRGDTLGQRRQASVQLAASHAVASCGRAATLLYEAAGMVPVFVESALGRCQRDLQVLSQNAAVSRLRLEGAGRTLFEGA